LNFFTHLPRSTLLQTSLYVIVTYDEVNYRCKRFQYKLFQLNFNDNTYKTKFFYLIIPWFFKVLHESVLQHCPFSYGLFQGVSG